MRSVLYAIAGQQSLAFNDTHTDDTDQLTVFDVLADTTTD